ncbi:MAG: hypothetical protein HY791_03210 [Deltaproteobacteria bacterium]|nr:hypothetical protein [Deltaproteobacteria bacterium]
MNEITHKVRRWLFVALASSVSTSWAGPGGVRLSSAVEVEISRDELPPHLRAGHAVFLERCRQCHELKRPLEALATGVGPVSGTTFEANEIKQYVVRMMRKRGSKISREDAVILVQLLVYIREVAKRQQVEGFVGGDPTTSTTTSTVGSTR